MTLLGVNRESCERHLCLRGLRLGPEVAGARVGRAGLRVIFPSVNPLGVHVVGGSGSGRRREWGIICCLWEPFCV